MSTAVGQRLRDVRLGDVPAFDSNPARVVAMASVAATGVGLLVPTGSALVAGGSPASLALAGFGALVATLLVAAAALIYRSSLRTSHTVRIAGWNLLGLVALGSVFALVAVTGAAQVPTYVAADVLGVSAVAHVLIGFNDVQRIRAQELAENREKLAVLNRVVRHNLRHDAQIFMGHAEQITATADDPTLTRSAETIRERAEALGDANDVIREAQRAVEEGGDARPVDLASLARDVAAAAREDAPGADVGVEVSEGTTVRGGDPLRVALEALVENALEHTDRDSPRVVVRAHDDGSEVVLSVHDDGPGIPALEREVVTGDREITQLDHGSGLGLWAAKWIGEAYGGRLSFAESDLGGTAVRLHLARAA